MALSGRTAELQNPTLRKRQRTPMPTMSDAPTRTRGHFNYFLRRRSDGVIKIGETTNLPARIAAHNREAARNLQHSWEFIAAVPGDKKSEAQLHAHFRDFAFCPEGKQIAELFTGDPCILRWLRWLRNQPCAAVTCDDAPEHRPYQEWCPGPGRELAPSAGLFTDETYFAPRIITGDDYYTPVELLETVREIMGTIDLDPASHVSANARLKITHIYTEGDNGLARDWFGSVWLNPPFSEWPKWSEKARLELKSGRITQLVCLATTLTVSALYIQPLVRQADALCLLQGRLSFWGKNVEEGNGAGASSGHVLMYFGKNRLRFVSGLSPIGTCWLPYGERMPNSDQ
jgi:hypothetical protein